LEIGRILFQKQFDGVGVFDLILFDCEQLVKLLVFDLEITHFLISLIEVRHEFVLILHCVYCQKQLVNALLQTQVSKVLLLQLFMDRNIVLLHLIGDYIALLLQRR
jgi:hypothetical protein